MRFQTPVLQVLRRDGIPDGKVASQDCALRAAQGLKVGLGDFGRKKVCGERPSADEHVHVTEQPALESTRHRLVERARALTAAEDEHGRSSSGESEFVAGDGRVDPARRRDRIAEHEDLRFGAR